MEVLTSANQGAVLDGHTSKAGVASLVGAAKSVP
jgi:hypothetical protein